MSAVVASFATVYSAALRGEECAILDGSGGRRPLPVRRWARSASPTDRLILAQCHGPTLDVGCGPGRMTRALAELGHPALGIDLVPEAVRQARARGVAALVRDVFAPVPAEGRWASVLLADGNIGIGGDPRRLLGRVADLVEPGGRVVVDLAEPGTGVHTRSLRLATATRSSRPFSWAVVGPESMAAVLPGTGLVVESLHDHDDRWFAVLRRGA
jgi:SAM-dependent methyltransferase